MKRIHEEIAYLYLPKAIDSSLYLPATGHGKGKKKNVKLQFKKPIYYRGHGEAGYLYLFAESSPFPPCKQVWLEELISYNGPAVLFDVTPSNELLGIEVVDFQDDTIPIADSSWAILRSPAANTKLHRYYATSPCGKIPKTITTRKTPQESPLAYLYLPKYQQKKPTGKALILHKPLAYKGVTLHIYCDQQKQLLGIECVKNKSS